MNRNFQFQSNVSAYSPINAHSFALISQLCYEPFEKEPKLKKQIREQVQQWGFKNVYFFDFPIHYDWGNDIEALLLVDSEKMILGFRGTEVKWREWFYTNFFLSKINKFGGKVHEGFYRAFITIWESKQKRTQPEDYGIKKILLTELKNNQALKLWITGHSLGGALAILAGASCYENQPQINVAGIYTYGQPPVGNRQFAESFNNKLKAKTFRFVNNNDIVPRLGIFDWEHVGQEKYFDAHGNLKDGSKLSLIKKMIDRVNGRYSDLLDPSSDGLKDHALSSIGNKMMQDAGETYLDLLSKQIDENSPKFSKK